MPGGQRIISRCRELAKISETEEGTFRTFLSPAMRRCYETVSEWMEAAGMSVTIDNAGNVRGKYSGDGSRARPLLMGSHLDTVRNAGAFDGILGVVLAIELVAAINPGKLPFDIEVVGFSEEEGVRFGTPFIGSHALAGTLSDSLLSSAIKEAIRDFGLQPEKAKECKLKETPLAFLEFHIEQGPVLDDAYESLAIVDSIVGLTRAFVTFKGHANHAGTTPLRLRRDALCGAAEWISMVEHLALASDGLVATVGKLDVSPGVANAVPGEVTMSLDCRHANDARRFAAVEKLQHLARLIAERRQLECHWSETLNQPATPMDADLVQVLDSAACKAGFELRHMASGAGHDAMVLAPHMPAAMLFLRSPGGLSHHPDENVLEEDVENALRVGEHFIQYFCESYSGWKM